MFDPIERVKYLLSQIEKEKVPSTLLAKVVNVSDPELQGRLKVELFISTNKSISYSSDWSKGLNNLVKGQLPKNLLNQYLLCFPVANTYENLLISLPVLIYKGEEELPEACIENLGLTLVQVKNSEAFQLCCLLRNNKYIWEQFCPLKHGHQGGDTQDQDRDSSNDIEMPIDQGPINDSIFGTSINPYVKDGALPPILT